MSENKAVICWKEWKRLVGGEILSEKSLEISLSLEIGEHTIPLLPLEMGEHTIPFYFSDEGLVRWTGEVRCWGDLKKELKQTPPFSLDNDIVIPVEVYPYSGMWKCDLYEVQMAINAIKDKIRRRNIQIEKLRGQLKQMIEPR